MYTVKILNDEEFDSLPYGYVKEALGCADPKTNTAYVRKTGIKPLDMFVTEHELEELIAKTSPHEVDGIRYKSGGGLGQILAPVLGGIGALFGMPFLGTIAGAALGAGTSGYSAAKKPEKYGTGLFGMPAALSGGLTGGLSAYGAGKAVTGFMNPGTTASVSQNALPTAATSGQVPVAPTLMQRLQGAGQAVLGGGSVGNVSGTPPPPGATPTIGQPAFGGSPSRTVATIAGRSVPFSSTAQGQGLNIGAMFEPVSGMALNPGEGQSYIQSGAASTPGSSSLPRQQYIPSQNSAVPPSNLSSIGNNEEGTLLSKIVNTGQQQIQQKPLWDKLVKIGGNIVPLVGSAFSKGAEAPQPMDSAFFADVSQKIQSGTTVPLTDAQRKAVEFAYDQELKIARENLQKQWKIGRPESNIDNDSAFRKAATDLENKFAQEKASRIALMEMGLSQQQIQNLQYLANMDVERLAIQAGIDSEEAKQFKQMLAELGLTSQVTQGQSENTIMNQLFEALGGNRFTAGTGGMLSGAFNTGAAIAR